MTSYCSPEVEVYIVPLPVGQTTALTVGTGVELVAEGTDVELAAVEDFRLNKNDW